MEHDGKAFSGEDGVRHKTAAQMKAEHKAAAMALPLEVRRRFWSAMVDDHMTLGEAREIDNIDLMVAGMLVILCHARIEFPMMPEDLE